MNRILNAIKCAICQDILESPVLLPCTDSICKKHVTNQTKNVIRCEKCGVEHLIPATGFHANSALQEIIEAEIANLDLGSLHKEAKKSCESFEDTLREVEVLLKDSHFYTHERINELKNTVQLKGEELKLIIDEEMKQLMDRLEEYERQSKEYLSSNEFKIESQKLENKLNIAQSNLDSWLASFNNFKIDEEKWKGIKEESEQKLKCITEEMGKFKNMLLLNKFEENQNHVNCFKSIKIDSIYKYASINRDFLDSKIINESSFKTLEELLKKKYLNGRKWSLLYQGSRDGFEASDFHSRCDDKPNTLIIVKSTSGSIFGGYTSAQWKSCEHGSWKEDNSAFIFSLVNKENRPLLFEQQRSLHSIGLFSIHGPVFGMFFDICIADSSNTNTNSYANLGLNYTHPDYPYGSDKAKTILAGTYHFKVQEIEVFQLQHYYKFLY